MVLDLVKNLIWCGPQKLSLSLDKDLFFPFFGDHLNLDRKTVWMKTNHTLGQNLSILFLAPKTAPPIQIPGYFTEHDL